MRFFQVFLVLQILAFPSLSLASSIASTAHGPRQWYIDLNTDKPFGEALQVTNAGEGASNFELRWNDGIYYRYSHIVSQIAQLPDKYEGEPLHQKAFRYVRDRKAWWESFATGNWHHHPLVNLNGLGLNVCGTDSRVFGLLLHNMGYQTRTTWYPHHGVAGVYVNDRWEMYDLTYGAYYMDERGNVVDEQYLAKNSSPITDPVHKMVGLDYSDEFHVDYSHSENNAKVLQARQWVGQAPMFNNPAEPPQDEQLKFTLPKSATLTLPVALSQEAAVRKDGYPVIGEAPIFAGAVINVPAGTTGEVDAPLSLVSVEGQGSFLVGGHVYDTDGLNAYLSRFDAFNHKVEIKAADSDLIFSYSLNAKVLSYGYSNEIIMRGVRGEIISNLKSDVVQLPNDKQVPTGTLSVISAGDEQFSVDGLNWYDTGAELHLPSKGTRWDAYMLQFRNEGGGPVSPDQSVQIMPNKVTHVSSDRAKGN